MIVVSGAMNFLFMRSLAATEMEGYVLGGASAAADVLKASLPWFIAIAYRSRRYVFTGFGSLVFAAFSLFSLASALGFAADARGVLVGSREAAAKELKRLEAKSVELGQELVMLGQVRPESVILLEMAALKQDRRFTTSSSCTNATARTSREFCAQYLRVDADRQRALESVRVKAELTMITSAIANLEKRGAGGEADHQVAVLATLLDKERDSIRTGLVVAVAFLVELGSGLGLWLALGHSDQRGAKTERDTRLVASASASSAAHIEPKPQARLLPPPPIVRATGAVIDFALERVQRSQRGGVTLFGLYRGYESWCRDRDFDPITQADFEQAFVAMAETWGIPREGDRYVCVRIGQALA
jgi:hypothetical protein